LKEYLNKTDKKSEKIWLQYEIASKEKFLYEYILRQKEAMIQERRPNVDHFFRIRAVSEISNSLM
jgi:hypothetical protein